MNPEPEIVRVVLDTNILFSAVALPKDSPPSKVLDLARNGKIEVFISPFILRELENNLSRKVKWDEERIATAGKTLKSFVSLIEPTSHVDVIKRIEADNRILECALDAKATVLVTGNMKDLRPLERFRGIEILSPREFLDKYFPGI